MKTSVPFLMAFCLAGLPSAVAEVDFAKQVFPILKDRCIECHGPEKQKAKLRLDSRDSALKDVVVPGNVEESELFYRITVPADDDDIMPPKGDPLTAAQVEIIRNWILEGAKWAEPQEIAESEASPKSDIDLDKIKGILNQLSEEEKKALSQLIEKGGVEAAQTDKPKAAETNLEESPVTEEETAAMDQLREATGALVMRVAQNANWIRVNGRLVGEKVTDESLQPLAKMPNLYELDLSKTAVSNEGLAVLEGAKNLTRLNLSNTQISDAGLEHVSGLPNLTYLNVYGTQVGDAGLEHLKDLKTLQKLYIWQSKVTDDAAANLKKNLPGVDIIGGWTLTEEPAKEEEKQEEKQEEKSAEKEPEATKKTAPTIANFLLQLS